MYDRRLMAGAAAIALVAVAAMAFMALAPRLALGRLSGLVQQQLGRSLGVDGGAHLDFAPLAIRLDGATLSGAGADDDSFVTARSAEIPVSLGQLFGGAPHVPALTLTEADIALLVDERGKASWDFAGLAPQPLRITLEQSRLRYFDARNSQAMALDMVDGVLDIGADGGAAFAGTAVINNRLVRIDAALASLARVNADGSPLELALSANEGAANFSGRLATATVLNLAGTVSLSSDTPGPALRLLGLPLPDGTVVAGPIAIDGALDSAGRAYAIRNATLAVGGFNAAGDLAADLRNAVPKLQARLTADRLTLDGFLPASGATDGDWGRVPLPFAVLRDIDAEVDIQARSLAYRNITTGPANVTATLAGGKLAATIDAQIAGSGTLSLAAKADATALPPSVALSLDVQDSALQPLLGALTGASQVTGNGDVSAGLTASGTTQEELAGTLKGSLSFGLARGHIGGIDLQGLFLAARQTALDGWPAGTVGTDFDTLNGTAAVEDGIASFRDVKLENASLAVTAEGILDVLRQGLAISATATVNGQPLLPVAVIAKGLWNKPRIYPDIPDILKDAGGGVSRLPDVPALQGN